MSIESILRRFGLLKRSDPTSPQQQPGKPALTPEEIQARLDWLRSPGYQAVRREAFDHFGIRIEKPWKQGR